VKGPVSVEVTAIDKDGMMKQGTDFAGWNKHVVVKLPTTREGVKACKALSEKGIKINMTLCFSPSQALLVAKAGATYVSPFVGRVDDISINGMDLIRQIVPDFTKTTTSKLRCWPPRCGIDARRRVRFGRSARGDYAVQRIGDAV
jgi:transaldolase